MPPTQGSPANSNKLIRPQYHLNELDQARTYIKMATIIVFGPTGHVGSAVALSAHAFGAAKVVLAMRDPTKPVPGLTPTAEADSSRAFERVRADLLDAESVRAAAASTGATRAFVYLAHGSPDHMRAALEALKAGGVQFVVFLSTGNLRSAAGDEIEYLKTVPPSELTLWLHAQVEINLHEVFGRHGEGYVAVRSGFFARNAFWWKSAVPRGEVKLFAPELKMDWITPSDIGGWRGRSWRAGQRRRVPVGKPCTSSGRRACR